MIRRLSGVAVVAGVAALGGSVYADGTGVPAQPADPYAAKAYGVFAQACAQCHQSGRLKGVLQPAGGLGNILDLAALATNPALVVPGNADASPLYTALQSRFMPMAAVGDAVPAALMATDLASVRDWIEQVPPATTCDSQARITPAVVATAIGKIALGLPAAQAARTRFISLVPLHNACASADDIASARQAVSWLINSLSLGLEPVKPEGIGPDGLILPVELTAIGWTPERWDRLAELAPVTPFTVFDAATRAALGTAAPLINADWLADSATRAPLYDELLGLPQSLPALLDRLRITLNDTRHGAANRIGLKTSVVARGNRLLERRTFANGAAWISSEYAPTSGRPDLFDLTIAAATTKGAPVPPHADATLVHFDLPNGFPAFFIADADGARSNDVPLSILRDDAHPTSRITAVRSCLGCHGASPVALDPARADDLQARVAVEKSLTKEMRETLLALHDAPADLARKIDDDRARFRRVLDLAGVDPARQWDGQALLPALMERYRRAVTLAEVADLSDMEPKALLALARQTSAATADVVDRLAFGPVPRAEVDAILPEIAATRGLRAVVEPAPAAAAALPPQLVLKVARPVFRSGDLLVATARANVNCYLTLLTIDATGRATVLYPNEFDANNFIEAGHDVLIPSSKAPYQFRLRDKGMETLIGICADTAKPVDGIHHNFEMERFTELGDYRAFLNRHWDQREPTDAEAAVPAVKSASRRAGETAAVVGKAGDVAAAAAVAGPVGGRVLGHDRQVRTSIRIKVE